MHNNAQLLFENSKFAKLSPFQQNLYLRLLVLHLCIPGIKDLDAEEQAIKKTLYPLNSDLRESQVQSALTALTLAGMIAVYPDDTGHPYLRLISADSLTAASLQTGEGGDYRGGSSSGGGGGFFPDNFHHQRSNEEDGVTVTHIPNNLLPNAKDEVTGVGTTNTLPSSITSQVTLAEETTDNDYDEQGESTMGTAYKLGYTDQDGKKYFEVYRTIQEACVDYGLNDAPGCIGDAMDLADKYSMDWLLKAMRLSRDARMKWGFVESVLERWKSEGGPEAYEKNRQGERAGRDAKSSRKRTAKSDAELDEELKKWGVHLG